MRFPTILFFVSLFIIVLFLTDDVDNQSLVILPVIVVTCVGWFFFSTIFHRDRVVPLFDIGCVTLIAMLVYFYLPVITMVVSGFNFTVFSPKQFFLHQPTESDMLPIIWRYVVYIASFALSYLNFRTKRMLPAISLEGLAKSWLRVFGVIFVFWFVGEKLIESLAKINLSQVYDNSMASNYEAIKGLPLIVQQLIDKYSRIFLSVKIGLIFCLMCMWRNKKAKHFMIGMLVLVLIDHAMNMRMRTDLILMTLSVFILYDRLVKHINLLKKVCIGFSILTFFLLYGLLRGQVTLIKGLESVSNLGALNSMFLDNEFQVLFAGTYDLFRLVQSQSQIPVPWHASIYELTLIIPSQILPFQKWDPQQWYYSNFDYFPGFFMFNPVCQSLVGFGWLELVLRGALLGWMFSKLHNWYVGHSDEFWANLFYLWMIVWSYYTIRSSSFEFMTSILQVFVPLVVIAKVTQLLLGIKTSKKFRKISPRKQPSII